MVVWFLWGVLKCSRVDHGDQLHNFRRMLKATALYTLSG